MSSLAASASPQDLSDMLELISKIQNAKTNGEALAVIAGYRMKVRQDAGLRGGIPEDMVLVNKVLFDSMLVKADGR